MEYEHIVEERDYEYGPGKELADLETAKTYVSKVRNEIYTKLILAGYGKAVEVISEESEGCLKLKFVIKYPVQIFD